MDATLCPTDADLLRALVPLVPATTLQAMLDELGLGSVPHNRLLEEALVSIVEAVPVLRTRLLGQVHLTFERAAALLQTTPSTLKRLVQTGVLPLSSSENTPLHRQEIVAAELFKRRSYIRQHLAELPDAAIVEAAEPSARMRYEPITRAFLSGP